MVKKLLVLTLFFSILLCSCVKKNDGILSGKARLRIGHGGGYLSAAVFATQQTDLQSDLNYLQLLDLQQFNSSSDIAYGLLSGTLDAGFVEADRLTAFSKLSGFINGSRYRNRHNLRNSFYAANVVYNLLDGHYNRNNT